jgi:hypothetical protein
MFFTPLKGGSAPPKVEIQSSRNYMLWVLGKKQKESDQSDQPALRKRSKGAVLLKYFDVSLKQQILMFSLGRVIGLSRFILHCATLLRTQV